MLPWTSFSTWKEVNKQATTNDIAHASTEPLESAMQNRYFSRY